VINPPEANKYCYWTNSDLPSEPENWLAGAVRHEGSWWKDWGQWISEHAGALVAAPSPGDGALPPFEDAPGSYVKVRLT